MTPTTILTYTGQRLDLAAPDPAAIRLADIAHGLAHTIRWRGALGPLTVAQHAVLCSHHVLLAGNRAAQRVALLHDAAEAYLGDVPSPAKRLIPGYATLEARLLDRISDRYCLAYHPAISEIVEQVDLDVRSWEVQTFRIEGACRLEPYFSAPSSPCPFVHPALGDMRWWVHLEARMYFELRAQELGIEDPT